MIHDFWLCGYPSIWRTATDKYWELNGIDMLRYLLLLMRVALQVCEPHTALDFPEKNIKSNKKSNRTLKFTCSNCSFQLESSQKILKTSKHHIAAAPLAQMESLQSLLPAVLPCKHQRCVVPTLDEELWQIVAINSRDLEMLNFLDALWMPLSPRPSSAYEHPGSPDQEFLIFWPILNISCFPPEAAPSLTLQVAPGSKFRYAILTSTPLLAYDA